MANEHLKGTFTPHVNLQGKVQPGTRNGGGGGTDDHKALRNRDAENQHPIEAITGLREELDNIVTPDHDDLDHRDYANQHPISAITDLPGELLSKVEEEDVISDSFIDLLV